MKLPVSSEELNQLMAIVENGEKITFEQLEAVYVDEDEIVRINSEFLGRDYITDIITFRYDEESPDAIEGTLYCCAQRITEQSRELEQDLKTEFIRVFIHGLIHLAGYDDQTPEDKKQMTLLEDRYLKEFQAES